VPAALAILLAMSPAMRVPDLWVEAHSAAGAELPELAEAVARALVAGGARVVLGGSASEPCPHCARVAVTELGKGRCRIEVTQDTHAGKTTLSLGANNPLLDRARAIAIQARLLVRRSPLGGPRPAVVSDRKRVSKATEPPSPEPEIVSAEPSMDTFAEVIPPPAPPAPLPAPVALPASPPEIARTSPETTTPVTPEEIVRAESAEPEESAAASSDDERRVVEEVTRPPAEERTRRDMPVVDVRAEAAQPSGPRWPWIPMTVGTGAAVSAAICALMARNRYDALAGQKSRPYDDALALKREGERWQTAAYVASGVAAVGIGVGIWGFLSSEPGKPAVTPTVSPTPGGAVLSMSGGLP